MTRASDLPDDQQAVLRLLLRDDGISYDEIARKLRMAPAAVRDRAHDAVSALGPQAGAPPAERRRELADYLLGQQQPGVALATYAALERSDQESSWARAARDALAPLAPFALPEVPGLTAGQAALLDDDAPLTRSRRPSDAPTSRRGGAILLGVLALVAALAGGFFIGRATKDDAPARAASKAKTTTTASSKAQVDGQANLVPPSSSPTPKAKAVAQFVTSQGQRGIVVQAQGLPVISAKAGYPLWLTGSGQAPVLLGYIQGVDAKGDAQVVGQISVDPSMYQRVELTAKTTATPKAPGTVLLAGPITFRAG
ncbi:unannotated protein [freshwater metagenome]|uniref:Unannotated protein n=1 Tax=freshwater metagenome TaxID=449393 RepID=A0A6J7I310_9ZZZZ|nr:hypothetical protein [Actinomycetota bacterium]